jgi:D-sedoheptulose 7-phosphate isomerase
MHSVIRSFRDSYADQFADGMSTFIGSHGLGIIQQLRESMTRQRSTIYIFGNGGSHAISKCMAYALQNYALSRKLALRVETGVDVYKATCLANESTPGMSFVHALEAEGADSRDTVILISGSGDSDNLCEVARYTERLSIPTLALIGSNQGKLKRFVQPDRCFCAPIKDQQISEDIIQSLAYFLDKPNSEVGHTHWAQDVSAQAENLRHIIRDIPADFIFKMAESIIDTFYTGQALLVLGLNHPALSVCAEHTAHNLYWDSIYQVDEPPSRLIWSTPTACDVSGITNDRRKGGLEYLTRVSETKMQGTALLYSMTLDHPMVEELLARLRDLNIRVFILSGSGYLTHKEVKIIAHQTGLTDPQVHAGISQIFGHLLGRIVRLGLIEGQNLPDNKAITDPAQFLINFDLAQRRLLDG